MLYEPIGLLSHVLLWEMWEHPYYNELDIKTDELD